MKGCREFKPVEVRCWSVQRSKVCACATRSILDREYQSHAYSAW
jgi:hypothetical protein